MEYHKIDSVFHRDPGTNHKTFLMGEWSRPEFKYLSRNFWRFDEKVDGTNIRIMVLPVDKRITFGARTAAGNIPPLLHKALEDHFLPLEERLLEEFPSGAVLYGEGYGGYIQKAGKLYRPDPSFVLFDVKIGDWWLERSNVIDIAGKFSVTPIPVVGIGTLYEMITMVKEGFNSRWGDFPAEGIVARPTTELRDRGGRRIITKVKSRDFA